MSTYLGLFAAHSFYIEPKPYTIPEGKLLIILRLAPIRHGVVILDAVGTVQSSSSSSIEQGVEEYCSSDVYSNVAEVLQDLLAKVKDINTLSNRRFIEFMSSIKREIDVKVGVEIDGLDSYTDGVPVTEAGIEHFNKQGSVLEIFEGGHTITSQKAYYLDISPSSNLQGTIVRFISSTQRENTWDTVFENYYDEYRSHHPQTRSEDGKYYGANDHDLFAILFETHDRIAIIDGGCSGFKRFETPRQERAVVRSVIKEQNARKVTKSRGVNVLKIIKRITFGNRKGKKPQKKGGNRTKKCRNQQRKNKLNK